MKLKMTITSQLGIFMVPLLSFTLIFFILCMVKDLFQFPVYFLFFVLTAICLLNILIHLNYYLHERKRTYIFDEKGLTVIYKTQSYEYGTEEIQGIRKIHPLQTWEAAFFSSKKSFFVIFPFYYYMEVVLRNGKVILISSLVHTDLEIVLKRLLPGKWYDEECKIIPFL